MASEHIRVVAAHRPPFVLIKYDPSGRPDYSGLLIDLFKKILTHNNKSLFTYNIYTSPINAGGSLLNGQWTGVTGELVNGNADVALFPLTRTAGRLAAIECTYSYLDQGLSLLIQSSTEDPGPLSVLAPFSLTLWVTLLCTVIAISLLFWALDRYGSWIRARQIKALQESGHLPQRQNSRRQRGRRSHVMTSFMAAAGAPERPRSTFWGSQVLYVVYCFFCVIVLSSYTANLTSFLAVRRANEGIEELQDVLHESGLIAVNPNGSTASYFVTSQDSIATRLRDSIWYCETVEKCVEAVRQGHALAFVSDSSALEYQAMQTPCNLAVVGKPFGPGNLVIGLQKNSSLLPLFNAAMQDFIEDGTLSELRRSWFDKLNECGEINGQLDNSRLTISQMLGVFVLLAIGVLVAFTTGTVENLKWCLLRAASNSQHDGSSSRDTSTRWTSAASCESQGPERPTTPSLRVAVFNRLSSALLNISKADQNSGDEGDVEGGDTEPCAHGKTARTSKPNHSLPDPADGGVGHKLLRRSTISRRHCSAVVDASSRPVGVGRLMSTPGGDGAGDGGTGDGIVSVPSGRSCSFTDSAAAAAAAAAHAAATAAAAAADAAATAAAAAAAAAAAVATAGGGGGGVGLASKSSSFTDSAAGAAMATLTGAATATVAILADAVAVADSGTAAIAAAGANALASSAGVSAADSSPAAIITAVAPVLLPGLGHGGPENTVSKSPVCRVLEDSSYEARLSPQHQFESAASGCRVGDLAEPGGFDDIGGLPFLTASLAGTLDAVPATAAAKPVAAAAAAAAGLRVVGNGRKDVG
ncbi:hypothetical protein Vretimale_8132 [Volvox reticuliferus]|uniref:Ionotropic glutamate receptor C-terminal domain-containing protein n=1 Tax=Volvox reticuliferus TaxID=1737510 RepID=A0A8J4FHN4_9CHLO|nr:hypothetical protein Vretifemale_5278 [Volvox reticuliferus]GIM03383.1 hypothetical protein Vretimale_8132 [Volvox reticuliferus]